MGKLINSFFRRISNYIALNTSLYLSHKPDFQTKLHKINNFDSLYKSWIENSPKNDKGDLVRLYFLLNQIEYIKSKKIPGHIAEVGVFKGTTARLFHSLLPDKKILLFDTFTGFDERDIKNQNETSKASSGGWEVSFQRVKEYLGNSELIELYPGYFPETTQGIESKVNYALVHLDADLYNPQLAGLEYFYPKISPGGVLIVHDCNNEYFGSKKAIDEFFLAKPEVPILIPDKSGSAIVIKI